MLEEVTVDETWLRGDQPEKGDEAMLVRFYLRPKQNALKTNGGEIDILGANDPKLKALMKDADRTGVKVEIQGKKAFITGAGRPIFDEVEYVEIRISDKVDKFNQHDRPATPRDRKRFRRQYQAFLQANTNTAAGTPLSKWPLIASNQIEELKYLKIDGESFPIRSVEELAAFPDEFLVHMGSLATLKKQAAAYLESARGQAPLVRLQSENSQLIIQMGQMQEQLAQLMAAQKLEIVSVPRKKTEEAEPAPEVVPTTPPTRRPGRPRKEASNGDV